MIVPLIQNVPPMINQFFQVITDGTNVAKTRARTTVFFKLLLHNARGNKNNRENRNNKKSRTTKITKPRDWDACTKNDKLRNPTIIFYKLTRSQLNCLCNLKQISYIMYRYIPYAVIESSHQKVPIGYSSSHLGSVWNIGPQTNFQPLIIPPYV